MRRYLVLLAVLALSTTGLAAGMAAPAEMSMAGGAFVSSWDADDVDDPGLGLGVLGRLELMENVCAEARLSLYSFSEEDEDPDAKIDATLIPIEVGAVYRFPVADQVTVYGGGGIGYYVADAEVDVDEVGVSADYKVENGLGFYLVGGGAFQLNDTISLFGELKYTKLTLDDETTVSIAGFPVIKDEDEVDMTGLAINIGAMLKF